MFPNPHADQYLVYVRYGPGVSGIGSVMIRRGAQGFTVAKPSKFMSDNEWAPLYFDNVYVPPEDVLLPAGGFKKQGWPLGAARSGVDHILAHPVIGVLQPVLHLVPAGEIEAAGQLQMQ